MLQPLAYRVRPKKIDDVVGQNHILGENKILRNSINVKTPLSFILFGPPGTGKTTIAEVYANELNANYIKLNAVTSNKKDLENAINSAKNNYPTILLIDEVHRINKDKQDILLPFIEDGTIFLIGATTSNPYISINKAIRSRCHLLEVKKITQDDMVLGLKRVLKIDKNLVNFKIDEESLHYISHASGGDFRFALNFIEILNMSFVNQSVTLEMTKSILQIPNYIGDKDDDDHYDAVSALQKSIRGSDVDAALYYAARLCLIGDLDSLYRRLLVTAYEDVGIANPAAAMRTKIAIESAEMVGLPEAIIPLSVAIVDLCLSPKSKAAEVSMGNAMSLAQKMPLPVMDYLKYTPVNALEEDKYPYDIAEIWPHLQYLPELIKNEKIFEYNKNASSQYEKALMDNYQKINSVSRSNNLRELRKKYK